MEGNGLASGSARRAAAMDPEAVCGGVGTSGLAGGGSDSKGDMGGGGRKCGEARGRVAAPHDHERAHVPRRDDNTGGGGGALEASAAREDEARAAAMEEVEARATTLRESTTATNVSKSRDRGVRAQDRTGLGPARGAHRSARTSRPRRCPQPCRTNPQPCEASEHDAGRRQQEQR